MQAYYTEANGTRRTSPVQFKKPKLKIQTLDARHDLAASQHRLKRVESMNTKSS
jgi:hypothetical protein